MKRSTTMNYKARPRWAKPLSQRLYTELCKTHGGRATLKELKHCLVACEDSHLRCWPCYWAGRELGLV